MGTRGSEVTSAHGGVAECGNFCEQSAHGDVPVPKLLDKNEFGNNRALLRTMVQQKTGTKPAKNLTRDSLVRRIVTRDREDELDAYARSLQGDAFHIERYQKG